MEVVLRILTIAAGVLLLGMSFLAFVRKRLTEGVGLMWGLFSIVLILLGAVPALAVWTRCIAGKGAIALVCVLLFVIFGGFSLSTAVSKLVTKNRELAMQVSLLNQENEKQMKRIRTVEHELQTLSAGSAAKGIPDEKNASGKERA